MPQRNGEPECVLYIEPTDLPVRRARLTKAGRQAARELQLGNEVGVAAERGEVQSQLSSLLVRLGQRRAILGAL